MPYMILSTTDNGMGVDIAPYIESVEWSENDLDSPDAGRALNGKMFRGKVTSKRRADIKLLPCKAVLLNDIFPIIRNEYFYCETDLVPAETPLLMEMYNSTRKGGVLIVTTDGEVKHKDVGFNIIER